MSIIKLPPKKELPCYNSTKVRVLVIIFIIKTTISSAVSANPLSFTHFFKISNITGVPVYGELINEFNTRGANNIAKVFKLNNFVVISKNKTVYLDIKHSDGKR